MENSLEAVAWMELITIEIYWLDIVFEDDMTLLSGFECIQEIDDIFGVDDIKNLVCLLE